MTAEQRLTVIAEASAKLEDTLRVKYILQIKLLEIFTVIRIVANSPDHILQNNRQQIEAILGVKLPTDRSDDEPKAN
jgi:hypothetical protein